MEKIHKFRVDRPSGITAQRLDFSSYFLEEFLFNRGNLKDRDFLARGFDFEDKIQEEEWEKGILGH